MWVKKHFSLLLTAPQGKQQHKFEDKWHLPLSTREERQEDMVETVAT